ncbi:MAG: hypothetical protein KDA93_15080 [Planctomycetaceae bacterium]|nr:hypothetical protein [Planctomycetaceae bacterium]
MLSSETQHPDDPQDEYTRRRATAVSDAQRLEAKDARFSTLRGLAFLTGLILTLLFLRESISGWWLVLVFAAFLTAVVLHLRVVSALTVAKRRVGHYQAGLDRLQGRWRGIGATGERYRDAAHVYTDDLDIFGDGSLFQQITAARTRLGEDQLADWFREPADCETILLRQQAILELRNDVELREQLALLNAKVHDDFDQNALLEWIGIPSRPLRMAARVFAGLITLSTFALFLMWWFQNMLFSLLLISLAAQTLFLARYRKLIMSTLTSVDDAGAGLAILEQVLDLMENRRFESPLLIEIVERLRVDGVPPSQTIGQLNSLIGYLNNSLRNQFFAPLAVLLCLPLHLVHAIERWRESVGSHIPQWCSAVAEFEALVSLSRFTFEHPEYPFPQLSDEVKCFEATELGHPLLSKRECVANDVCLDEKTVLLLVSGSNMSGKSTLLRTIGTNVVLALTGAPVRAKSLRLSPFQLGTAMRISDSLQEGKSLFFAVLKRIKRVVDLADGERPLLFLLDEILQGTNSHDRRIGAEAVIRNLINGGAIGLVTTHDLALTDIADTLPGAKNVHFADQLKNGEMTFDYHLRHGVVEKSNAIELMRLVGLKV